MTLRSGIYKADTLVVDSSETLFIDASQGPVIVLVANTLIIQGKVKGQDNGFPGWVVGYAGTADVIVGSTLDGTFFAPNSRVNMSIGNARHEGTVVARNIELHQGGRFTHHPFPEGVAAFRKLFGLSGTDLGDCPFAVPLIAVGRNGFDPISLGNENTPRLFVHPGFNRPYELANKEWDNEVAAAEVAWGDFDGDGQDELAVGRSAHSGGKLWIYDDLNQGFKSITSLFGAWGAEFGITALATGDIDGDGLDEIVAARTRSSDDFEIVIVDDAIHGFGVIREIGAGDRSVHQLAIGNVDDDPELEILAARDGRAGSPAPRVMVIQGPSQGFAVSGFADWGDEDRHAVAVAIGNLDGLGNADIAVGRSEGGNARTLIYRFENGTFNEVGNFNRDWGGDRRVTGLAFADLDGDGNDELVVGRDGHCGDCDDDPRLMVFDEPFTDNIPREVARLGLEWGTGRGVLSLAARDVDFDGKAEIVAGRTAGPGPRVVVFDDAVGAFRPLVSFGEGWEDVRSTRSLAVSRQLFCQSRPAPALPNTVAAAEAGFPLRRDNAIRFWLKTFLPALQAGPVGNETASQFAVRVFGGWSSDDADSPHVTMRKILAGAAAIHFNLSERPALLAAGFVDLMNRYFIENMRMFADVGTDADFDFAMMEILEVLHFLEPLAHPTEGGAMMLSNEAINKLSLRNSDFLIPYTANVPHHMQDPILIPGIGDIGFVTPETENHVLMINTWAYLMNQSITKPRRGLQPIFGPLVAYQNAGSTLEQLVLAATGRFLKNGSWETNARPYQAFTVRALNILASYADDVKVQTAATNALDTLAAKFAFQSLHGKRLAPMRRNYDYRGHSSLYESDYIAATFGVLTGATVFDTDPDCQGRLCAYSAQPAGFALDAALLKYKVAPTIHDLMLRPDNHRSGFGAWARMHDRYTEQHYLLNTDGRYPVPNGLPQPDLNQMISDGTLPIEPQAEFYFVTRDYLNSAGGRTEHYGAFDALPRKVSVQTPIFDKEVSLVDKIDGTDFFGRPSMLIGNRDFGYWSEVAGLAQETLLSEDLGTYKNFFYGRSKGDPVAIRIPNHWQPGPSATVGDATFTVIKPASMRDVFSASDYYLVVGQLPAASGAPPYGIWEVVPRRLFPNEQAALANVVQVNGGNSMSATGGYEYTLTVSGEKMSLNLSFPAGAPFLAIDGSASRVEEVHLRATAASMPLMDVRQVDDRYRFTGVRYVCASGDGRVIVNNPFLNTTLELDARNHQQPGRTEKALLGNPCTDPPTTGAGGVGGGGVGGAGGGSGGGGGTGGGGAVQLPTQLIVTGDWGSGYCVTINVTNNTNAPIVTYTMTLSPNGTTLFNSWNGTFTPTGGLVFVTPAAYHARINPGETDDEMGFCATRIVPGQALPFVVNAIGTF